MTGRKLLRLSAVPVLLSVGAGALHAQQRRPMSYADLFRPSSIGQTVLSPDGSRLLYTVTHGSYPDPSRDTRIRLAALDGTSDRPMTQWVDGDHRDPAWHPSGERFGFTAERGGERQLYVMRPEGGEATQVTHTESGVLDWAWSHDGRWLAWLTGRDGDRQVWIMDGDGRDEPRRLTSHRTPVQSFEWRNGTHEILFVAADDWDEADARRRREGFEARTIQRGLAFDDFLTLHPAHVWVIDVAGGAPRRVTEGAFRVEEMVQSPGGDRLAIAAASIDRYADGRSSEVYLADLGSTRLERLTDNGVGEELLGFSPDGAFLAVTAPTDFMGRGVDEIHVRPVAGGDWNAITRDLDNDIFEAIWKPDGRGIYFVGADGVNRHLFEVAVDGTGLRALTRIEGVISLAGDEAGPTAVVQFTDPTTPADLYSADWRNIGDRDRWTRLTRTNEWVDSIQLATYETVRWTSRDGTDVEGILIYPLDYDPGRSYPLITDIHGGPASAYQNSFDPTQGRPQRGYMHLMAAQGYAVFRPNYRGSSNYGAKFKTEISGDYWTRATEDIHAGIDALIERGIAHPDSLGFMGWSAGGHWSNWMLVTSDRFKAIASGAGVANWISLYGQTDAQDSREFYLGRDPAPGSTNKPWDDFDHWWNESPLKYIANASTPTLIHFGGADERIPMPQGQELHMALKHRGVPTEFIVYPGEPHGLREPRNQLVKMMSEMAWFDKWIRGHPSWLDWDEVLRVSKTIEQALRSEQRSPH